MDLQNQDAGSKEDRTNSSSTATNGSSQHVKNFFVATTICEVEDEDLSSHTHEAKTAESSEDSRAFRSANEFQVRTLGCIRRYEDMLQQLKTMPQLNSNLTFRCLLGICGELVAEGKLEAARGVAKVAVVVKHVVALAEESRAPFQECADCILRRLLLAEGRIRALGATHDKKTKLAAEAFLREIEGETEQLMTEANVEVRKQFDLPGPSSEEGTHAVLEQLPESLRESFYRRDAIQLRQALRKMSVEEAERHMEACVTAGLWRPDIQDSSLDAKTGLVRDSEQNGTPKHIEEIVMDHMPSDESEDEARPARKTIYPRDEEHQST